MNPPDPSARPGSEPPSVFASALARASARLGPFGRQVQYYADVESTNDAAAACAAQGASEGLVVLAGRQTAGRGRHGRTWQSPAGAGLYFSVVLRPSPTAVPLLTLGAGVAMVEGIRATTGVVAVLKWPNDVYVWPSAAGGVAGRKLAGILAEAGHASGVGHVILGVGINVRAASYPASVAARATSLERELGHAVDPGALLAECLASLKARYDDLQCGRAADVLDAWRAHAKPLMEHPVEWDEGGFVRRGVVQDVDASGALVVRTAAGVWRVTSGEVRWN